MKMHFARAPLVQAALLALVATASAYVVRTNAVTGDIGALSGVPLAPRTIGAGFDFKY